MLSTIGSFLTGRAAKAGVAAIFGAIAGMTGAGTAEWSITDAMPVAEGSLALWQYLAIGAATGFINWITVYGKANRPTEKQKSQGLY